MHHYNLVKIILWRQYLHLVIYLFYFFPDEIIDVLETSSSSGDELMMQDMAVGNDPSNGMLMSMPEILIAST